MKIKEIISLACFMRGNTETENYINNGISSYAESESKEVEKLIRCYELVAREIACEYFPLKKTEEFTFASSKVDYSDFNTPPYQIYSVKNIDGAEEKFSVLPTYVSCKDGKKLITYSYIPTKTGLEDESEFTSTVVDKRVLALGIVSEAYLSEGLFDEAIFWQNKFKEALQAVLLPKKQLKMPARIFA